MNRRNSLWQISVLVSMESEDAVSELLASLTGKATAAFHCFETGISTVSVYTDRNFDAGALRKKIADGLRQVGRCGLKTVPGTIKIARVKRQDWKESWKRHFKPLEISGKLLIRPSWHHQSVKKGQSLVVLDPGLSFGTGQHPTTSFCLHQIADAIEKPVGRTAFTPKFSHKSSFLDIGTGSGILAIAAAKLGFRPVHAFDFDPEAVRVAKTNARKNRVDAIVKPLRADITKLPEFPSRKYDLVCSNLISNLLIAERRRIVNRVKPGGTLVLAGILAAEFHHVKKAFEAMGANLVLCRVENEWCSGSFIRNNA